MSGGDNTRLYAGCCGWSEAQPRYFADFSTIELQSTFYQPPAIAVAQRWKARARADFRFCMKAWQLITHTPSSPTYRRLKSPISPQEKNEYGSFRPSEQVWLAWERTRDIAAAVDARVIVFQCPRSFLPTPENLRNLCRFFADIDRGGRTLAWEPRGQEWIPGLVEDLCKQNNLVRVVDPFGTDPAHDGPVYWRLHGKTGYRYRYTDDDLTELHRKLDEHADRRGPNYVMFNNIYSRQDASRFLEPVTTFRNESSSPASATPTESAPTP